MITIKIYKYSSSSSATGYRGTDYSSYVLQGFENEEKLNQEIDVSTITLQGLIQQQEFDPETKFIIDVYQGNVLIETLNRVVSQDTVNKPILSNNSYFNHTIEFVEPSAIAQKRLVDNISITYKLKDVSLESVVDLPINTPIQITTQNTQPTIPPTFTFGKTRYTDNNGYRHSEATYSKYILWEAQTTSAGTMFVMSNESETYLSNKYYNLISNFNTAGEGEAPVYKAKFLLPKPKIMFSQVGGTSYTPIGYASYDWEVIEYDANGDKVGSVGSGSYISSDVFDVAISAYPFSDYFSNSHGARWLMENFDGQTQKIGDTVFYYGNFYFKKYTDETGVDISSTSTKTNVFTIQDGYSYKVNIKMHEFDDDCTFTSPVSTNYRAFKYSGAQSYGFCKYDISYVDESTEVPIPQPKVVSSQKLVTENTSSNSNVVFYSSSSPKQVFSSAIPYNAYTLIEKVILNSGFYNKTNAIIPSYDISQITPFYIDPNYELELSTTRVIESFYNHKNLWEVLLEVGYYIHAIPEIKFGKDNLYMITFNKLGETNQSVDQATKSNIMNFRGIDDYISATSSYITNMVQLGGQINEYVTPKTSSEQYLVYNDNVEIHTTKPIIELLEIYAIPTTNSYSSINLFQGVEYDMTSFVYEKNVYDILSISKNDIPNKGIAIYYNLSENKIQGCQYQLPQTVTNPYTDYAIKKVLYLSNPANTYDTTYTEQSTGPWANICVNDFIFRVVYRTKDDVRQTHTRPDLRKYLLNSPLDKFPQHYQINNQTDTLVDSVAFGKKMYGTLVKTGNSEYTVTEWINDANLLKHKGELYNINGNLYYVAKIKNIYFVDHIISQVEYTKDYNQLSQIVGIPSEPRFYEISEQSMIRRDFVVNRYLLATTENVDSFNFFEVNLDSIRKLTVAGGFSSKPQQGSITFPKYAITTFKGDQSIGAESKNFGESDLFIDVITPMNVYTSGNTLTYEWDMMDNFGAGNNVENAGYTGQQVANNIYRSMKSVQYTDKYGKATLMDYYILQDLPSGHPTYAEVYKFPISPIKANDTSLIGCNVVATNQEQPFQQEGQLHASGIILMKDCREAISINHNLQLITSTDQFVTSPYFFQPDKKSLKLVLLNKEVDKLSNGLIDYNSIILPYNHQGTRYASKLFNYSTENITTYNYYTQVANDWALGFKVDVSSALSYVNPHHFDGTSGYEQVKAIAIIGEVVESVDDSDDLKILNKTKFVFARNIPSGTTMNEAIKDWKFGNVTNTFFTNKQ